MDGTAVQCVHKLFAWLRIGFRGRDNEFPAGGRDMDGTAVQCVHKLFAWLRIGFRGRDNEFPAGGRDMDGTGWWRRRRQHRKSCRQIWLHGCMAKRGRHGSLDRYSSIIHRVYGGWMLS